MESPTLGGERVNRKGASQVLITSDKTSIMWLS